MFCYVSNQILDFRQKKMKLKFKILGIASTEITSTRESLENSNTYLTEAEEETLTDSTVTFKSKLRFRYFHFSRFKHLVMCGIKKLLSKDSNCQ